MQQLKLHDPQQRLDFALQFLARIEVDDMWPENIPWTDEAHCTLKGAVNTQNCRIRIWGSTKPLVEHQWHLHSAYVTVWCGFTSTFILRPFLFEGIKPRGPVRCTVTFASYENILMQRVIPCKYIIIVFRPLFLCWLGHHRISVAKFVCFVKPSQMKALSPEVFQILSLHDLLT